MYKEEGTTSNTVKKCYLGPTAAFAECKACEAGPPEAHTVHFFLLSHTQTFLSLTALYNTEVRCSPPLTNCLVFHLVNAGIRHGLTRVESSRWRLWFITAFARFIQLKTFFFVSRH